MTIAVSLPEELVIKIRQDAETQGISLSELVRRALELSK